MSSDNVAKVATTVAGSAAVGNAVFNTGENRQQIGSSILLFYVMFGGFYGTWIYLKSLSQNSPQFALKAILPAVSALGGAFIYFYLAKTGINLRIEHGWDKSFWFIFLTFVAPAIIWGILSSWCFDKLESINEKYGHEQLVSSKLVAFWLQVGFLFNALCVWALFL